MTISIKEMVRALQDNTRYGMSDHMEQAIIDHLSQPSNHAVLVERLQHAKGGLDMAREAGQRGYKFIDEAIAALSRAPDKGTLKDAVNEIRSLDIKWDNEEQPANPSALADHMEDMATDLMLPVSYRESCSKAAAALRKSDVLQHLRDGGKVQLCNHPQIKYIEGLIREEDSRWTVFVYYKDGTSCMFSEDNWDDLLRYDEWQPYAPEPKQSHLDYLINDVESFHKDGGKIDSFELLEYLKKQREIDQPKGEI